SYFVPQENRPLEGRERLWIRDRLGRPAERPELPATAVGDRLAQVRIAEIREVLKRRARGPLLSLKQQRHHGREQGQRGGHARAALAHEMTQPLTRSAIADLVVVL